MIIPSFGMAGLAAKLATVGVVFALILAAVLTFAGYQRDVGRDEVTAKWDAQRVKDLEALNKVRDQVRKLEGDLQAKVEEAQRAKQREHRRVADMAASAAAADERLRDSVDQYATGLAIAQDSLEACRERTSTLGSLHSEALRSHRQCQVDSEALASDVRLLLRSWPVIETTP